MRSPDSLGQQRLIRCRGELLRGSGIWPSYGSSLVLEPPFEPFEWSTVTEWDLSVHGFQAPYQGLFIDRIKRLFAPVSVPPLPQLEDQYQAWSGPLHLTTVAPYAEDEVSYGKAEQFILSLGTAHDPITFELFGIGPTREPREIGERIEIRFLSTPADLPLVESQLHLHFPRSAIVSHEYGSEECDFAWQQRLQERESEQDDLYVAPLYLKEPYCFPLRQFTSLGVDPLGTGLAVMEELGSEEWAVIQVMFCRAKHDWAKNLRIATQDPYREGQFMVPNLDRRLLSEKLEHPLYGVSVVLAANRRQTFSRLGALVHQYESPHNQLCLRDARAWASQWSNDVFPDETHWRDSVADREPLAPGMLLNAAELAGLVHLPNPALPSERLMRVKSQTRQPPKPAREASSVVIGQNMHRGKACQVAIPPDLRSRHCYIAGASGTGKSTLLLNMIVQDMQAGHGVGFLDPHGDLVKAVLRHVPANRIDDVILFDASDAEYPFALNILDAHDEAERERIVAETIMSLERYFPASWGPRLERILQYTIRTVLHAVEGATLADVEQMLTDEPYRQSVVSKTTEARLLQFWQTQFPYLPKNACDPVLNKLSVFLLDRHVRNITCQRRAAVNFDHVLNEGKILLANLSTGLLTEKVAGTLGSFLVTKIVNAAFRRAGIPEQQRRPFYLYVDEFQAFMNLSVGFERILAESRKYKLTLAGLANQFIGQISSEVKQAIFGNVGTMIVFRLGMDDAHALSRELGVFTPQDILNLELGQAIVRSGGSSAAFNLQTYPEALTESSDPTSRILSLSRQRYARSRREVEKELAGVSQAAERRHEKRKMTAPPSDPWEDDLVT